MVNPYSCIPALLFLEGFEDESPRHYRNFVPFKRFIWDKMRDESKIVPRKTFSRDGLLGAGMAAHGLVNGMSGSRPTGMSGANLPRLHLRRARYRPCKRRCQILKP